MPPRFGEQLTVVEVCNAYRRFAHGHYRRDGQVTKAYDFVVMVLKMLGQSAWGRTPAEEFGPFALKAYRQVLLADSPDQRDTIAVVSNSGGCTERPKPEAIAWMVGRG